MRIQQLLKNRQTSNIEANQQLRPGQIVQGNILKLFPNERAQIQLGSQQFIAQLEAALAVGKSYHFQIQHVDDDIIHLKVLSELAGDHRANMRSILRHFGLNPSRQEMNFMQMLINENIPFNQSQLMSALDILSNTSNKNHAQQILKQMFLNELPLNNSFFQALSIINTNNFANVINEFRETLQNYSLPRSFQIEQIIHNLQGNNEHVMNQSLGKIIANQPAIGQLLQSLGIISQSAIDFLHTNNEPERLLTQINHGNQPNIIKNSSLNNIINHLLLNEQLLITYANELITKWTNSSIQSDKMTMNNFQNIQQVISEQIVPLLASEQQQFVKSILHNEHSQIQRLHQFLTYLTNSQTYTLAGELQSVVNYEYPKQYFLLKLSHVINDLGLSYEHSLANDIILEQQSTLKPILLQFISELEGLGQERAQQLLNYINGLQIQSVQESTHFIQANLVLLGEKIGLHNDIQLEFESKKTSDGKINPDFCRILFYLDLAHLEETVIDMNIQKRFVSITVFNDNSYTLSRLANKFKPRLEAGLQFLQYDLTTINFKPFQVENKIKTNEQYMSKHSTYEGIDFRI